MSEKVFLPTCLDLQQKVVWKFGAATTRRKETKLIFVNLFKIRCRSRIKCKIKWCQFWQVLEYHWFVNTASKSWNEKHNKNDLRFRFQTYIQTYIDTTYKERNQEKKPELRQQQEYAQHPKNYCFLQWKSKWCVNHRKILNPKFVPERNVKDNAQHPKKMFPSYWKSTWMTKPRENIQQKKNQQTEWKRNVKDNAHDKKDNAQDKVTPRKTHSSTSQSQKRMQCLNTRGIRQNRWVPLNPNMDNPNSRLIRSHTEIAVYLRNANLPA